MSSELLLVGVDHDDPDGSDSLRKVIRAYGPEVIGIEASEKGFHQQAWMWRVMQAPGTRAQWTRNVVERFPSANIRTVDLLLENWNFESGVVAEYAESRRADLIFCEPDERDADAVDVTSFVYPRRGVLGISPEKLRRGVSQSYASVDTLPIQNPYINDLGERDSFAEGMLREIDGRALYVGGAGHIFSPYAPPDEHNLHERLSDLDPSRMKLNEADSLTAPGRI